MIFQLKIMITRHNTDNKEEVARKEKVHVVEFVQSELRLYQRIALYIQDRHCLYIMNLVTGVLNSAHAG